MSHRPVPAGLSVALLLAAAGAAPGQIIHRYTFNGNANDSVGTADATLVNATINGSGQVVLDNGAGVPSNTATGKYVSLPPAAFPTGAGGMTNFTVEVFYNWVGQPGQTWDRLFDFNNGNDTTVTPPRQYLFLTPRSGAQPTNTLRYAITSNDPGNEFQVNSTDQSPFGGPTFVALTYDLNNTTATLYVGTGTTLTQVGQNLTSVLDPTQLSGITNRWIGRSAFDGDPLFNGTIDQFDIFGSSRSFSQVQADFLAGPVPVPEPTALTLCSAAALGLAAWRGRTARRSGHRSDVRQPGSCGPLTLTSD